jgi:hypothetical protein
MGPLVETLGRRYGGWYPFAAESAQTGAGWRAVPWYWVAFPATYNMAHFRKAGLEYPKTWDELLKHGRVLKKQGNPVGIPISHCGDANTTFWSVFWCYGGKVLEVDGKTPAINSEKTAQVLEWYKALYLDAMDPEVLSWDDSGNNRFILSGKGSWIHNPISPYNSALANKMPIADDINHHPSPAGPAGTHSAPGINALAIWKFSKNAEPAKEFIEFLFRKENFDAFIVASNAFNQPPLRDLADPSHLDQEPQVRHAAQRSGYAHPRGWPAKPNDAVAHPKQLHPADMVSQGHQGMPVKRVMSGAGSGRAGGARAAQRHRGSPRSFVAGPRRAFALGAAGPVQLVSRRMSAPGPLRLISWWGALLLVLMVTGRALAAEPSDQQAPREERRGTAAPVRVIAPGALPGRCLALDTGCVDASAGAGIRRRALWSCRMLERLPGVTLRAKQGNPLQPTLTLRGLFVSPVTGLPQGVSVFLDGVRINEPTVEEVNFDLIPLEAVDRIEVIRGPSVLFGRNTLGAAISLTTRRGEERREIATEISGGSFGHVATRFLWSGEARPLDYYLSLTASYEDGYRDATESRVARAFGKIGVRTAGLDATVSYQYSNDRIKQAGSLPQSELRIDRRANFTAGDFFAPELNMAIVNARYPLGDTLTLEGNGFVRALSAEQFNVNLIAVNTRLLNSTLSAGGSLQASARSVVAGRHNVAILASST